MVQQNNEPFSDYKIEHRKTPERPILTEIKSYGLKDHTRGNLEGYMDTHKVLSL